MQGTWRGPTSELGEKRWGRQLYLDSGCVGPRMTAADFGLRALGLRTLDERNPRQPKKKK
jgi:hypothetical protein